MDNFIPVPEQMTDAIFDTEPDLVSPDCQQSIGRSYDQYFPATARAAVAAVTSVEIPGSGDEVCHLICSNSCGFQWKDPTRYFVAAEVSDGETVVQFG